MSSPNKTPIPEEPKSVPISGNQIPAPNSQSEIQRLAALYELNILDTPPEERFDRITRLAGLLMQAPIAYIAFIDADRQWFKSRCNLDASETPRNISFCNYTIQQDDVMIIPDALLDPRFADSPLVLDDPHTRFYAGYPLSTPEGQKVGTLCVIDTVPRDIPPEQIKFLRDLAALAEDQLALVDIIKLEQLVRTANAELAEAKINLEKRNEFIRKAFSCYMSDEVVESLFSTEAPLELGGEERRVTALFCDLRDFTVLTEHLPPKHSVKMLNNYYEKMVDVILKHKGTIDAFIGDAILVLFGAPSTAEDDAFRAIACAIEMQLGMAAVNEANRKAGLPELTMGIGINTGFAAVGNIGSSKRMKYSAIGSPINLAARIQDFSLGGQVLISEVTMQEVRNLVQTNGHLRVKMKGIKHPVIIYDIGGIGGSYNLFLNRE